MTTRGQFLGAGALALAGLTLMGAKRKRRRFGSGDVSKPNVILVVCDDLDRYVYERMTDLRAAMEGKGTAFANFHVATSVCVPSRITILRGQYAHNSGISENDNGAALFRDSGQDRDTLATRMNDAGYVTWFGGKYLNGAGSAYPDSYKPPGWDLFSYYKSDYRANVNGRVVDFSPQNYTDWLSEKAVAFVEKRPQPFFMQVCTKDPHEPMHYPDRHAGKFGNAVVPKPPSFNEADLSDKPQWVRESDPWTDTDTNEATREYRERLRAMSTTEDLVLRVVNRLAATGQLANTFIFLTSDNGFHRGLHGISMPKWTPYTEAHRVPFVVRGPGVAGGATPSALASNIDIAPTILDLAGAAPPDWMDGRSLKPVLLGQQAKVRDVMLLDGGPAHFGIPEYRAAKTEGDVYVEYGTGEREYYLATEDPYQLDSRHSDPAHAGTMAERASQTTALYGCSGDACRIADTTA